MWRIFLEGFWKIETSDHLRVNWVFSAVRLLLTGAHSVGSEHLAPESKRNRVLPVRQVENEARLQVCFRSLIGIKVQVIWVSQSNFKTALWLLKRGKCAPHHGGVGRTWHPGEILAYKPPCSVYSSKSWASVCSLWADGTKRSEGGQSFRDERVTLPGELRRDSTVLWQRKDRFGTWSRRTQFWEP